MLNTGSGCLARLRRLRNTQTLTRLSHEQSGHQDPEVGLRKPCRTLDHGYTCRMIISPGLVNAFVMQQEKSTEHSRDYR